MLNTLAKSIRFDNASKGFDPLEGGLDRYLLLTISEICEAQEELRDGRGVNEIYYEAIKIGHKVVDPNVPDEGLPIFSKKPCGFPVEIADAAIRIMDIMAKLEYNVEILEYRPDKDPSIDIDSELIAIISTISVCFREHVDKKAQLTMALNALFILAGYCGFNMMNVIQEKLAFNRTRPPKHGRKF